MPEKKKVILIGCGVAGISAAINLTQAGFDVEIFESKNFPGGRVYSLFDEISKEEYDNGQHLLSGAYKSFLWLLELLGTDNLIRKQKNLKVTFSYPDGERDILDTASFNGKLGFLAGLSGLKKLSISSKFHILTFLLKLLFNTINQYDYTVRDFLKKNNQTDESIKKFWEPLTLATLNADVLTAPAGLLVVVLKKAFFSDKNSSTLIFPAAGLSDLLAPFNDWFLKKGGKIHFGKSVREIIVKDDTAISIKTKDDEIHNADFFISTVQPNALAKIIKNSDIDSLQFDYLRNFEFSSIISIYLWLDKELPDIDFSSLIGAKTQWLFNRRLIMAKSSDYRYKGYIALTISAGNELSDMNSDELINLCFEEVKLYFPKLREARILHKKVIKDKFATVKLTKDNIKFRPKEKTYIKNLFLAGDWTDTKFPATIEGAAISGKKASEAIIEACKQNF